MYKVFSFIFIVGLILLVTSCKEDGRLRLHNNTDDVTTVVIENEIYDIAANDVLTLDWRINYSIISVGEKTVSCEILERLFLFGDKFLLNISAGSTTSRRINENAAGLEVKNNSQISNITSVYISPSSSPSWGINRLNRFLKPGFYQQWNVTEGTWDIKVTDCSGTDYVIYNQKFKIGYLNTYNYDDLNQSEDAIQDKYINSQGETEDTYQVSPIK